VFLDFFPLLIPRKKKEEKNSGKKKTSSVRRFKTPRLSLGRCIRETGEILGQPFAKKGGEFSSQGESSKKTSAIYHARNAGMPTPFPLLEKWGCPAGKMRRMAGLEKNVPAYAGSECVVNESRHMKAFQGCKGSPPVLPHKGNSNGS